MAPRGRGGSSGSGAPREPRKALASKATTRGGIQKRRGGRTDTDGDLDMDAAGRRNKKAPPTEPSSMRSRPSTRSSAPVPRGASRAAQTVLKHLSNGSASTLASRISGASSGKGARTRAQDITLTFLRVHGLKESKAATNPGGGLNDLLGFMERKASTFLTGRHKRNIRIRKVC
jgi:nuclear RNA export factor